MNAKPGRVIRMHMNMALRHHQTFLRLYGSLRSHKSDSRRTVQITGQPRFRLGAQFKAVACENLHLCPAPYRSQNSYLFNGTLRSADRYGLFAGKLARLG